MEGKIIQRGIKLLQDCLGEVGGKSPIYKTLFRGGGSKKSNLSKTV